MTEQPPETKVRPGVDKARVAAWGCVVLLIVSPILLGLIVLTSPAERHEDSLYAQNMRIVEESLRKADAEKKAGGTAAARGVSDFDSVLTRLEGACKQNRTQLADMGVSAVQRMRDDGRKMGYLEFLRGIDSLLVAWPAPRDKSTDCTPVFAMAATVVGP